MTTDFRDRINACRFLLIVGLVFLHFGTYPGSEVSPFRGMQSGDYALAAFVNSAIGAGPASSWSPSQILTSNPQSSLTIPGGAATIGSGSSSVSIKGSDSGAVQCSLMNFVICFVR